MTDRIIPRHIAIIPDGNGRWAKKKGMPRNYGHKVGAEVYRKITEYASGIGLKYMSFYAFSTENWRRSKDEVGGLMKLLGYYLDLTREDLDRLHLKLVFSGRRDELGETFLAKIDDVVDYTSHNDGLVCNIALNYGGRDELVHAVRRIAQSVKDGSVDVSDIDEQMISGNLFHPEIPDPDMIIRTSGEERTSNFLMWEGAYSELYFTDVLWPDFKPADLEKAIDEFNRRNRRFGGAE